MFQKIKKLLMVLATSMLTTEKKTEEKLKWVPCIWYFITLKNQTKTLLNLESKINAINQAFASQLGFKIWKTNVKVQKIDSTTLKIYKIVVSIFFILYKDNKSRFFGKNF